MHIIPKYHIRHASHTSLVYMLKNIGLEGFTTMVKHSIRYFNNKPVRAVWDNEKLFVVVFCC